MKMVQAGHACLGLSAITIYDSRAVLCGAHTYAGALIACCGECA